MIVAFKVRAADGVELWSRLLGTRLMLQGQEGRIIVKLGLSVGEVVVGHGGGGGVGGTELGN